MRLTINIERNGATSTVAVMPGDLVAWEAHTGRSVGEWSATPPSFTDVAFLAWRAATRGMAARPDFTTWLDDGVTDVTLGDVADADPTPPGPLPG